MSNDDSDADEGKRRLHEYDRAREKRQEVLGHLHSSQKRRDRAEARRELRVEEDRLTGIWEAFFRDWREGWPVPDNCVVCDGEPWIAGNGPGRHLRPVIATGKPCVRYGERVEVWTPVPLIIKCTL
jgi:hypothetical protein